MKRTIAAALAVGLLAPIGIAKVTLGASTDTSCWDEYNTKGTRFYRTIAPKDVSLRDCTPGAGCFSGYSGTMTTPDRLYVPKGAQPATACLTVNPPATTTTTTTATTTTTTTVAPPPGASGFALLPPGSPLPAEAECASRVRRMTENRPENATYNATKGTGPNATYPRVTGNFTGTTDEIIQWTACKWGIDENYVRAQINNESAWKQTALGDFTTAASACAPGFPIGTYPAQFNGDSQHTNSCPESIGLGQVRWLYHQSAFDKGNATLSSAYNLDYTYAVWRDCYEGRMTWLNTVEGRGDYKAGDAVGCMGVWFAGRWYTQPAIDYIQRFYVTAGSQPWLQSWFPPALAVQSTNLTTVTPTTAAPTTAAPTTAAPTTAAPTTAAPTTAAPTTAAPTTAAPTTAAPTTAAPTTAAPTTGAFVESFAGNTGLDRFDTGLYHRDDVLVAQTQWTGDHDMNCGDPSTQRMVHRSMPAESFYLCKDHLMTSVGDTSGYSIAWFSPKQSFTAGQQTKVSFDVNVTDLGNRQWWEVSIVPIGTPFLATMDFVATAAQIATYDSGSVVVGKGPYGNDGNIYTKGVQRDPFGWSHVCDFDPEGCASKAIRRTFTITDNRNGTITFDYFGQRYTYPGQFPDQFKVYFKDHNYTPDKDGVPIGHTWHWDNISIT